MCTERKTQHGLLVSTCDGFGKKGVSFSGEQRKSIPLHESNCDPGASGVPYHAVLRTGGLPSHVSGATHCERLGVTGKRGRGQAVGSQQVSRCEMDAYDVSALWPSRFDMRCRKSCNSKTNGLLFGGARCSDVWSSEGSFVTGCCDDSVQSP